MNRGEDAGSACWPSAPAASSAAMACRTSGWRLLPKAPEARLPDQRTGRWYTHAVNAVDCRDPLRGCRRRLASRSAPARRSPRRDLRGVIVGDASAPVAAVASAAMPPSRRVADSAPPQRAAAASAAASHVRGPAASGHRHQSEAPGHDGIVPDRTHERGNPGPVQDAQLIRRHRRCRPARASVSMSTQSGRAGRRRSGSDHSSRLPVWLLQADEFLPAASARWHDVGRQLHVDAIEAASNRRA